MPPSKLPNRALKEKEMETIRVGDLTTVELVGATGYFKWLYYAYPDTLIEIQRMAEKD